MTNFTLPKNLSTYMNFIKPQFPSTYRQILPPVNSFSPWQSNFQNLPKLQILQQQCQYLFLNSELQLGKPKGFNNKRMKVQVNRAFKSYSFFATKKHEIFFKQQCKCVKVPKSPISKSMPPFSVLLSFSEIFSTPRINKVVTKDNVD